MTWSSGLVLAMANAIAAAVAWIAGDPDVGVDLIKVPFTPTPDYVPDPTDLADFTGSAQLTTTGTPVVAKDPATGDVVIQLADPAGGWKWVTTNTANLPQTIYGYSVKQNDAPNQLGAVLFDTPIVLTAAGQLVVIGAVQFRVILGGQA